MVTTSAGANTHAADQLAFDADDAACFASTIARLNRSVRDADRTARDAAVRCRDARKRQARAERDMTDWIDNGAGVASDDPMAFDRRLRELNAVAERADDALREAKGLRRKAMARRAELWGERKAAIRRRYERLPLFDGVAPMGEAAASVALDKGDYGTYPLETIEEPSGENGRADADAEARPPHQAEQIREEIVYTPKEAPTGESWPGGLTPAILRHAYLPGKLAAVKPGQVAQPVRIDPFDDGGRLWVCIGESDMTADVLPLVPVAEFDERYPGYERRYRPLPGDTPEGHLQWYSGIVVKVDRKEYAVATAGEQRTLTKPEGWAALCAELDAQTETNASKPRRRRKGGQTA